MSNSRLDQAGWAMESYRRRSDTPVSMQQISMRTGVG